MKKGAIAIGGFLLVLLLGGLLFIQGRNIGSSTKAGLAELRDSITKLRSELSTMKNQLPGLGEYMTAMQLHVGKLWFAAEATNWKLAEYEVNELGEAIDGAVATNTVRDSIKVSDVLRAMTPSLLDTLAIATKSQDERLFRTAYGRTLETCNGCHKAVHYDFMRVIQPTSPPVTNQSWAPQP